MNNRFHARCLAFAALTILSAAAQAQSLTDPTRPPASLGSTETAAESGWTLQSIIRSNRGKPAAIVNGEYVLLGGKVGDARLIKIGEDYVTLKTETGTETLMLVAGVEKVPTAQNKKRKDSNEGKK
jgi:MSHA biogenesis protein MshK